MSDRLSFGPRAKHAVSDKTMKHFTMWFTAMLILGGVSLAQADKDSGRLPEVPTRDMVTMLDLGAHKCIPCKMMAPILEKLKTVYEGKASIVFIDVWKHREQAPRFGVKAIPTQIFFDKKGKEIYRHVGYMGEEAIIGQLKKMGIRAHP